MLLNLNNYYFSKILWKIYISYCYLKLILALTIPWYLSKGMFALCLRMHKNTKQILIVIRKFSLNRIHEFKSNGLIFANLLFEILNYFLVLLLHLLLFFRCQVTVQIFREDVVFVEYSHPFVNGPFRLQELQKALVEQASSLFQTQLLGSFCRVCSKLEVSSLLISFVIQWKPPPN